MRRRDMLAMTGAALFGRAPAQIVSESARPKIEFGVQAGDVLSDRAIIWSRSDRPSRLVVEYSLYEDFRDPVRVLGPHALETTDFTARVDLTGLPPGHEIYYHVSFLDLSDGKTASMPVAGRFRTAPASRTNIKFLWSGDTAGQGYGINPDWGGMRIYESMRREHPDFFLHSGDTIYADGPIPAEIKLPDGSVWRNLTTPEKSKVAETLDEFRGNYRYNLMDENVRRFNAEVAQIWQWDDHEVLNNWSPGKDLQNDSRYREKSIHRLVARAARAFLDYAPMRFSSEHSERIYRHIPYGPLLDLFVIDVRSYRGPNTHNRQTEPSDETEYLGAPQIEWLKQGLKQSRATWKVIASDMPLGPIVGDGKDAEGRPRFENSANGDGVPLGRELEIADLLRYLKGNKIRNVVWLTADTHYTAAHYYDPAKAVFTDFDPFWEFVSGPLNAGTFGPSPLDNTFGPQVEFFKAPPKGQSNLPPSAGLQFYGEVQIDGRSREMTVTLKDLTGAALYRKTLAPAGA